MFMMMKLLAAIFQSRKVVETC